MQKRRLPPSSSSSSSTLRQQIFFLQASTREANLNAKVPRKTLDPLRRQPKITSGGGGQQKNDSSEFWNQQRFQSIAEARPGTKEWESEFDLEAFPMVPLFAIAETSAVVKQCRIASRRKDASVERVENPLLPLKQYFSFFSTARQQRQIELQSQYEKRKKDIEAEVHKKFKQQAEAEMMKIEEHKNTKENEAREEEDENDDDDIYNNNTITSSSPASMFNRKNSPIPSFPFDVERFYRKEINRDEWMPFVEPVPYRFSMRKGSMIAIRLPQFETSNTLSSTTVNTAKPASNETPKNEEEAEEADLNNDSNNKTETADGASITSSPTKIAVGSTARPHFLNNPFQMIYPTSVELYVAPIGQMWNFKKVKSHRHHDESSLSSSSPTKNNNNNHHHQPLGEVPRKAKPIKVSESMYDLALYLPHYYHPSNTERYRLYKTMTRGPDISSRLSRLSSVAEKSSSSLPPPREILAYALTPVRSARTSEKYKHDRFLEDIFADPNEGIKQENISNEVDNKQRGGKRAHTKKAKKNEYDQHQLFFNDDAKVDKKAIVAQLEQNNDSKTTNSPNSSTSTNNNKNNNEEDDATISGGKNYMNEHTFWSFSIGIFLRRCPPHTRPWVTMFGLSVPLATCFTSYFYRFDNFRSLFNEYYAEGLARKFILPQYCKSHPNLSEKELHLLHDRDVKEKRQLILIMKNDLDDSELLSRHFEKRATEGFLEGISPCSLLAKLMYADVGHNNEEHYCHNKNRKGLDFDEIPAFWWWFVWQHRNISAILPLLDQSLLRTTPDTVFSQEIKQVFFDILNDDEIGNNSSDGIIDDNSEDDKEKKKKTGSKKSTSTDAVRKLFGIAEREQTKDSNNINRWKQVYEILMKVSGGAKEDHETCSIRNLESTAPLDWMRKTPTALDVMLNVLEMQLLCSSHKTISKLISQYRVFEEELKLQKKKALAEDNASSSSVEFKVKESLIVANNVVDQFPNDLVNEDDKEDLKLSLDWFKGKNEDTIQMIERQLTFKQTSFPTPFARSARSSFMNELRRWRYWRMIYSFYPFFAARIAVLVAISSFPKELPRVPMLMILDTEDKFLKRYLNKIVSYELPVLWEEADAANNNNKHKKSIKHDGKQEEDFSEEDLDAAAAVTDEEEFFRSKSLRNIQKQQPIPDFKDPSLSLSRSINPLVRKVLFNRAEKTVFFFALPAIDPLTFWQYVSVSSKICQAALRQTPEDRRLLAASRAERALSSINNNNSLTSSAISDEDPFSNFMRYRLASMEQEMMNYEGDLMNDLMRMNTGIFGGDEGQYNSSKSSKKTSQKKSNNANNSASSIITSPDQTSASTSNNNDHDDRQEEQGEAAHHALVLQLAATTLSGPKATELRTRLVDKEYSSLRKLALLQHRSIGKRVRKQILKEAEKTVAERIARLKDLTTRSMPRLLRQEWEQLHPVQRAAFYNNDHLKNVFPEFEGFSHSDVSEFKRDWAYGEEARAIEREEAQLRSLSSRMGFALDGGEADSSFTSAMMSDMQARFGRERMARFIEEEERTRSRQHQNMLFTSRPSSFDSASSSDSNDNSTEELTTMRNNNGNNSGSSNDHQDVSVVSDVMHFGDTFESINGAPTFLH